MLAAWEGGLGTAINGQGIMQSAAVREHAGIPDDQCIMICIAMGYPDEDFVANSVKSVREDKMNFGLSIALLGKEFLGKIKSFFHKFNFFRKEK